MSDEFELTMSIFCWVLYVPMRSMQYPDLVEAHEQMARQVVVGKAEEAGHAIQGEPEVTWGDYVIYDPHPLAVAQEQATHRVLYVEVKVR